MAKTTIRARKILWILGFLSCCWDIVHSFVVAPNHQRNQCLILQSTENPPVSTSLPSSSSTSSQAASQPETAAFRFHHDLEKILARGHGAIDKIDVLERFRKPPFLENDDDHVEQSLRMLQRMESMGVATEQSYQLVLRYMLKRGRAQWKNKSNDDQSSSNTCAAVHMEELLGQLVQNKRRNSSEGEQDETISIETYNLVLEGYAVCSTPRDSRNFAQRAQDLYESMLRDPNTTPNAESMAHVLHAWAWKQPNIRTRRRNNKNSNKRSGDDDPNDPESPSYCARKAQSYLDQLQRLQLEEGGEQGQDDDSSSASFHDSQLWMQCHEWVVEAWSLTRDPRAGHQAQAVFDQRPQPLNDDGSSIQTSVAMYTNLIQSWTKQPEKDRAVVLENTRHAEGLLNEMLNLFREKRFPPNQSLELHGFVAVLSSYGRLNLPQEAERILWLLERDARSLSTTNDDATTTTIGTNCRTCNAVLHAYTSADGPSRKGKLDKRLALKRVHRIVEYMEKKSGPDRPNLQPDQYTYNSYLKAWVVSGEPIPLERMEHIVRQMDLSGPLDDYDKTMVNFNCVLLSYTRNDQVDAAKALLQRLIESVHLQPTIVSYTTVIDGYAAARYSTDSARQAMLLLDQAKETFRRNKYHVDLQPNAKTYAAVLRALSRYPQELPGSATIARSLVLELERQYNATERSVEELRPTAYLYNHVINCAANTEGSKEEKREAFQIAAKAYRQLRQAPDLSVDAYTYSFWLKACNALLDASDFYVQCVTLPMKQCQKDGLVTNDVLRKLQGGHLTSDRVKELMGVPRTEELFIQVHDIDPDWSRNVPRR